MVRIAKLFAVVALVVAAVPASAADKKAVQPTKMWNGSNDDAPVPAKLPEVIANAKDFEKIWKDFGRKDALPKVDFAKEMVVIVIGTGSRLNLSCVLDGADLKVLGLGTRDFAPGFRYVIATVSRTGVKTVNGKAIPK